MRRQSSRRRAKEQDTRRPRRRERHVRKNANGEESVSRRRSSRSSEGDGYASREIPVSVLGGETNREDEKDEHEKSIAQTLSRTDDRHSKEHHTRLPRRRERQVRKKQRSRRVLRSYQIDAIETRASASSKSRKKL